MSKLTEKERRYVHPARGMTRAQREVFERIAIGQDGCVHPKTAQALLDRGIIASEEVSMGRDRFGEIVVTRYYVPLPIHAQWCGWCSENVRIPAARKVKVARGKRK